MHWLGVVLIGLVIGAIAKLLMPGKDPGGLIITIVLGVAGAILGGFLSIALGVHLLSVHAATSPLAISCGSASARLPQWVQQDSE